MSHHAEDHLRSRLRQVEGLTDGELEADLAAYNRELLAKFVTSLDDRFHTLRQAWVDDDGKMYERVAPLYNLMCSAVWETQDDFNGSA